MSKQLTLHQKLFNLQQEIGTISKDAKNPFYKSKYFDINSLIKQLQPLLKKNRLLLLQPIEEDMVVSKLICIDGTGATLSGLKLPEITDPQKLGSAITYYRRYTLASLLGLQAVDDDGNIASNNTPVEEQPKAWLNSNTPLLNTIKDKIKAGTPLSTVKSHYNAKKEVWDELNEL